MREILFRGKRFDNGKWVEGGYIPLDVDSGYTYIIEPCNYASTFSALDLIKLHSILVIPSTVGQYTGLTDKNGVRIFEGDIVKTHYANAQKSDFIEQVVFHNGKFCAYFSNQLCKQWANLYDGTEHLPQDKSVYMDSVEVIGNIHDNPELLELRCKNGRKGR